MRTALRVLKTLPKGIGELAVVGDAPELVRIAQIAWRPNLVVTWGEPFDSPLWESRRDGFAYLCRSFVCEQPVSTPEALLDQITSTPTNAPGG